MLTQAPVKPLDEDGVQVGVIGTLAWVVAAIVLLVRGVGGPGEVAVWWLWTCCAGVGVGVVGLAYCLGRRSRRRQSNST